MTQSDKDKPSSKWRPATQAVRAGQVRGLEQEHSEPIYATSSFVFNSAEEAAARFANEEPGNVYSRFTNPTVKAFEERLALMEGGQACVATASGMAGLMAICMATMQQGDHIVAARSLFGASRVLLGDLVAKFGITTTFIDLTDLEQWQQALKTNTKMVFLETPTNPLTEVADIHAIANLVHEFDPNIKVVVDNCACSPALQQPLRHGADVILHSATKFIDGQGRCIGGAIVGSEEFVGQKIGAYMRTAGPALSPFNAWVFLKGLETLQLRVEKASDNAAELATFLAQHPSVLEVHYPGLQDHPQHELSKCQQTKAGAVIAFSLEGGQKAAWQLINNTELMSITANLGDTRTTITHPFTTTHARWSEEQKKQVGIDDSLIRIAVGLEDPLDLMEDLRF